MSLRSITPVVVCAAVLWVSPARAESESAPDAKPQTPAPAPAPAPVTTPAPNAPTTPAAGADKKPESVKLSNGALDLLVSGIALYPDPTVTAILEASTHPVELRKEDTNTELDAGRDSLQRVMRAQAPKYLTDLQRYPGVRGPLVDHIQLTAALGKEYKSRPKEVWAAIRRVRTQVEKAGAAAVAPEKTEKTEKNEKEPAAVAAAPAAPATPAAPTKPGDKPTPAPALNAVVVKLLASPAAADLAAHLPAMNAIENPKSDEKTASDSKNADSKTAAKQGDTKVPDPKATEPKAVDPKVGESKAADSKPADPKSAETKTADAKTGEAKKPAEDPYAKADSAKLKLVNAALRENWDSVQRSLPKNTAQKPGAPADSKDPQAK